MNTALSIAGSDCSGGAGIEADLKTMTMNGVYGMAAITALTAQNTLGVTAIETVSPSFLAKQLEAVFTDIYPDAVKIGMVAGKELIKVIASELAKYQAHNIVLDPVMVATSGARLLDPEAIDCLTEYLIPLAGLITPNIPEAEILSGITIQSNYDMEKAAEQIFTKYNCAVLCKGGHNINDANDYLYGANKGRWFYGKRINNPNTHGTGCTLSSAIAANLAKGFALETAVLNSKEYISQALAYNLDLGSGRGPLAHNFAIADM